MFRLLARKPVGTPSALAAATTNVPTSGWVQLQVLTSAASGLQIYNGTAVPVQIATGTVGNEKAYPLIIPPGFSSPDLPVELAKGVRLSAQAVGGVAGNTGFVIVNTFG